MEAMPLERLEAEITELAGHPAAGECRWLGLVAEDDRRAGHESWGCRTIAHWLSWHCGLDMRSAREKVRVAHALVDLPLVREEFAAGRLSYSKVRAITRVATPVDEEQFVMYAQHATAAQTERIVRTYRGGRSSDEETDAANHLHEDQFLQIEYDLDGAGVATGRVPPEVAASFLQALELARTRMPADQRGEGGPAGPHRSRGALKVDALAMIVETFLASEPAARAGGDRWMAAIDVDAEVITDDDPEGRCEVDGEVALAPDTVRRLCCDSSVAAIRGQSGEPPTVTKRTRTIPRWVRRAVHARDGGCRFPGCGEKVFIDAHHVRHWSKGGPSIPTNVLELCWFHHRLVHEGGWTVRFLEDDEVIAITPDGNVISSTIEPPAGVSSTIAERNAGCGVAVDERSIAPNWWNDPLHLGDIIGGLQWRDERGEVT
jgi:hypothetical protein